ncbi:MAG TPA: EVE domain-containing protein, partial [Firmicutes bacterium]|nr:EVE domain-containing protein [Bacillota bacterium]
MRYWLLKTEPETFSYGDLERLGRDRWNGVRNFRALKYLREMQPGDLA